MLLFLRTVPSSANSSACPASREQSASDDCRRSSPGPSQTPAPPTWKAFSPTPSARTGAEAVATLTRRHPECPPSLRFRRSTQFLPHKHQACRYAADCRGSSQELARPRLQDFPDHALRDQSRRAITDRRYFNFVSFGYERYSDIAVHLFDLLGFG